MGDRPQAGNALVWKHLGAGKSFGVKKREKERKGQKREGERGIEKRQIEKERKGQKREKERGERGTEKRESTP